MAPPPVDFTAVRARRRPSVVRCGGRRWRLVPGALPGGLWRWWMRYRGRAR
jgi:hypothetical protein